ncbi:MAG: hypothetical protein P8R54_14045 [Myxococcota bacterium]|nr:hypothetical protein [Myxococcota bacterium]
MLESIFSSKPSPWGTRGDPHLWNDLKVALSGLAPPTIDDFPALQHALYADRVGTTLSDGDEIIMVERFRTGSGMASAQFWCETDIPLLVERYSAAVADARLTDQSPGRP